jgi:hypothetical protein
MARWPTATNFNADPDSLDIGMAQWVRIQPWDTDPVTGENVTFHRDTFLYQGLRTTEISSAAHATVDESPPRPSYSVTHMGVSFENLVVENVEVSMNTQVLRRSEDTGFANGDARSFGVGSRLFKGSRAFGTQGAVSETYIQMDGYWFCRIVADTPTNGYKYVLMKVTNGTPVLAGEYPQGTWFTANLSTLIKNVTVRMTTAANGANVDIECYVRGGEVGTVEQNVISYTDTSPGGLATAGRTGFFTGADQSDGGIDGTAQYAAQAVNWVEARDLDAVLDGYYDDWVRSTSVQVGSRVVRQEQGGTLPDPNGGPTDSLFIQGPCAQEAFMCGAYANPSYFQPILATTDEPPGADPKLKMARALPDDIPSVYNGWMVFYDPIIPLSKDQDRAVEVDFRFNGTTPAQQRRAGIALRADTAITLGATIQTGYVGFIERNDIAGSAEAQVYRIDGIQDSGGPAGFEPIPLLIGTASVSLPAFDTLVAVRMSVQQVLESQPFGGVEVKFYYLGGQVVLQPEPGLPPGLDIQSDGTILDYSDGRVLGTGNVGFTASMFDDPPGAPGIGFDDWSEGAGGGAPGGEDTPEEDQLEVPVSDEADGTTGTLVVPLDWPVEEMSTTERYEHALGGEQYTYRSKRNTVDRRSWTVQATAVRESDRTDLITFYEGHKGPAIPFTWTTHKGEAVTVQFEEGTLDTAIRAPDVASFDFTLIEVLSGA